MAADGRQQGHQYIPLHDVQLGIWIRHVYFICEAVDGKRSATINDWDWNSDRSKGYWRVTWIENSEVAQELEDLPMDHAHFALWGYDISSLLLLCCAQVRSFVLLDHHLHLWLVCAGHCLEEHMDLLETPRTEDELLFRIHAGVLSVDNFIPDLR